MPYALWVAINSMLCLPTKMHALQHVGHVVRISLTNCCCSCFPRPPTQSRGKSTPSRCTKPRSWFSRIGTSMCRGNTATGMATAALTPGRWSRCDKRRQGRSDLLCRCSGCQPHILSLHLGAVDTRGCVMDTAWSSTPDVAERVAHRGPGGIYLKAPVVRVLLK